MTVKVIEKGFAKKDSVDVDLIIGESKVRPGHYWVFPETSSVRTRCYQYFLAEAFTSASHAAS